MEFPERIVHYHNKIMRMRVIVPYAASVSFALISALLIIYAPESRSTTANIVAGGLLVLAVGVAGFTRFFAKPPGMEIKADNQRLPN